MMLIYLDIIRWCVLLVLSKNGDLNLMSFCDKTWDNFQSEKLLYCWTRCISSKKGGELNRARSFQTSLILFSFNWKYLSGTLNPFLKSGNFLTKLHQIYSSLVLDFRLNYADKARALKWADFVWNCLKLSDCCCFDAVLSIFAEMRSYFVASITPTVMGLALKCETGLKEEFTSRRH